MSGMVDEDFYVPDKPDPCRHAIHEAGHAPALLVQGYFPVSARVFAKAEFVTEPGTNQQTLCYGYVDPPFKPMSIQVAHRVLYHCAGVAAEDWAVQEQLLDPPPSWQQHKERQACRNWYSLELYVRQGYGYTSASPGIQEVIKSRLASDERTVQSWIQSHMDLFNEITTKLLTLVPIKQADFETMWDRHFHDVG